MNNKNFPKLIKMEKQSFINLIKKWNNILFIKKDNLLLPRLSFLGGGKGAEGLICSHPNYKY